jgi:predicted nucleic acid-binding protein
MAGEVTFLDTNILLAATDASRPGHAAARRIVSRGRAAGTPGAWSGQVIREYLAVATRPLEANGLGMSTEAALHNVRAFSSRLMFCDETEASSHRLLGLVAIHELRGTSVHDANIVATMVSHGIDRLVTLNPDDFSIYPEVAVLGPADVDPG